MLEMAVICRDLGLFGKRDDGYRPHRGDHDNGPLMDKTRWAFQEMYSLKCFACVGWPSQPPSRRRKGPCVSSEERLMVCDSVLRLCRHFDQPSVSWLGATCDRRRVGNAFGRSGGVVEVDLEGFVIIRENERNPTLPSV